VHKYIQHRKLNPCDVITLAPTTIIHGMLLFE
jgi:hypothetical protein